MLRKRIICVFVMVMLLIGSALAKSAKAPIHNLPVNGGTNESIRNIVAGPESDRIDLPNSLDSTGTMYQAGTTWYDFQHNGSSGHMVSVDSMGYVHVVWMNGLNSTLSTRHVYYNVWDPSSQAFTVAGGSQVNSSQRGGYACQAVTPNGFCFPTFHEQRTTDPTRAHTSVSIDFLPQSGAFTSFQPAYLYENNAPIEIIWPKIDRDRNGKLHVISCENPASGVAGDPQRIYYSRGTPEFDADGFGLDIIWDLVAGVEDQFYCVDTVMVIAPIIACSKISDRIVIAYSHSRDDLSDNPSQYNNDMYMIVSEDGGINWGDKTNITNFIAPDMDCVSQDTVECDKDTLRVYTDATAIFDAQDNIHIGFTTCMYYSLEGTINIVFSDIWHWSEEFNEFTPIAHGEFGLDSTATWVDPGAWQRVLQRPNFSYDWTTGYMYCSYQLYDSIQTSENGFPQADAYVAVSCNNGRSWSVGVNVTTTDGGENAPVGSAKNERDITLADRVSYEGAAGFLHMEYIFDRDAGGSVGESPEGTTTLNPVIYRRIPIENIPVSPRFSPYFPVFHIDSTGMPGRENPFDPEVCTIDASDVHNTLRPGSFQLYQNYPNPFNPTTNIQFDLVRDAAVSLKIFNVLGQEVATIYNKQMMTAGARTVNFDASNLASGIYVYRLEVGGMTSSRKMVLMK